MLHHLAEWGATVAALGGQLWPDIQVRIDVDDGEILCSPNVSLKGAERRLVTPSQDDREATAPQQFADDLAQQRLTRLKVGVNDQVAQIEQVQPRRIAWR